VVWVSRVLAGECRLAFASMGKFAFALGIAVTKLVSIRDAAGDELASGAAARRASAGGWMTVWIDAADVSWAPPVFWARGQKAS